MVYLQIDSKNKDRIKSSELKWVSGKFKTGKLSNSVLEEILTD